MARGCRNCRYGDVLTYNADGVQQFYRDQMHLRARRITVSSSGPITTDLGHSMRSYSLLWVRGLIPNFEQPNWWVHAMSGDWRGRVVYEIPFSAAPSQTVTAFNALNTGVTIGTQGQRIGLFATENIGDYFEGENLVMNDQIYIIDGGNSQLRIPNSGRVMATVRTFGQTELVVFTYEFSPGVACQEQWLSYCGPGGSHERIVRLMWDKPLPEPS